MIILPLQGFESEEFLLRRLRFVSLPVMHITPLAGFKKEK
jgi:hypothetical protein